MLAVKGYYNGHYIIPEEKITLKKNQKVIITVLDEARKKKDVDLSKYLGVGENIWGQDAQEYVEELRNDDRY